VTFILKTDEDCYDLLVFLALFDNHGMKKRCIYRSLFNYDLLTTSYSSRVYMEVGRNDTLSANPPFTAGLKQSWYFNQLPGLTQLCL